MALSPFAFGAPDSASPEAGRKLFHVVSFKFKPTATPEQITDVENAFAALKTQVPGVQSLDWGTNVSPEHRAKGVTHCFVLQFDTEAARDAYLVAPAHKAFGSKVGPILAEAFVIDFWSK